ncbi:MAG TPA: tetratricopeptide repeat protein [Thermoanaerobaculia bacterium]|nr:tetratricopeptide repeat protein [Thermoanaerobaculia bacterium]
MSTDAATLIERANQARREHRLADAHRDFVEAVALSRQKGKQVDLLQALKGLGQIERDLGRADAARPLYEEAVAICRRRDDPLSLAHTIRHLADIHRDTGRPDLAEPCYDEALALYRSSERTPPLDLANAIRPFAILKEGAGDIEEARRLWKEARDLYAAVKVEEGVRECSARLERLGLGRHSS